MDRNGIKLPDWSIAPLRSFQLTAYNEFLEPKKPAYLARVCPGGGKTLLGERIAHLLLREGRVKHTVVVVPKDYLRNQWLDECRKVGIMLDDRVGSRDSMGCVLTYQGVSNAETIHGLRAMCKGGLLAIFDEIHHVREDLSWGRAMEEAFRDAKFRLALSGTPYRSDLKRIWGLEYNDSGEPVEDFTYSYGEALRDHNCRQVAFHGYDIENFRYRQIWDDDSETEDAIASLEECDEKRSALIAALQYEPWIRSKLTDAHRQLEDLRAADPNAAGLLIAWRQDHAEMLAYILEQIIGEAPVVVTSRQKDAGSRIEQFRNSRDKWIVAVGMVSEGVDIPRLRVGFMATNIGTESWFVQAVARCIRMQKNSSIPWPQRAHWFYPKIGRLREYVCAIEEEQRHAIADSEARRRPDRENGEPAQRSIAIPIDGHDGEYEHYLSGEAIPDQEWAEYSGLIQSDSNLRGRFDASDFRRFKMLDQKRTQAQPATVASGPIIAPTETLPRLKKRLRTEIQKNVGRTVSRRIPEKDRRSKREYQRVRIEIRSRCGARWQDLDSATVKELEEALDVSRRVLLEAGGGA